MHWDDRGLYEEAVCSVTVLGECVMTFRPSGRSNFRSAPAEEGKTGKRGTLKPWQTLKSRLKLKDEGKLIVIIN